MNRQDLIDKLSSHIVDNCSMLCDIFCIEYHTNEKFSFSIVDSTGRCRLIKNYTYKEFEDSPDQVLESIFKCVGTAKICVERDVFNILFRKEQCH